MSSVLPIMKLQQKTKIATKKAAVYRLKIFRQTNYLWNNAQMVARAELTPLFIKKPNDIMNNFLIKTRKTNRTIHLTTVID